VGLSVLTTYFLIINGGFERHICFVYKSSEKRLTSKGHI
jgi:hypothetical protein